VPAGFSVRPILGEQEAEPRARASHSAFKSRREWAPYLARYLRFVRSPVYDRERELVAAAPDGRIAAFAIWWPDTANRVGLFEPVGTHMEFQRLGLGRAVVREGLRRMRAHGLRQAIVCSEAENPGAVALYTGCGFQTINRLLSYQKPIA
jgi:ribosomal protein S18 acetylase RimI-like enzyme